MHKFNYKAKAFSKINLSYLSHCANLAYESKNTISKVLTSLGFDHSFNCIVVEDACATRDLIFKGKTIRASEVHASFMAALTAAYAQVITAREALEKIA